MKIFVGWSHSSEHYARALHKFLLDCFAGHIDVFASFGDIPIGAKWRENLNAALREAGYGVFCLTYDSIPDWICYEAGVLSAREIPVAPLLFDMDSNMVFSPLADGQAKEYSKDAVSDMAKDIYDSGREDIDLNWGVFIGARQKALEQLNQDIERIGQELRAGRRYTIAAFSADLERLKGIPGGNRYQLGYQEWLYNLGQNLIKTLTLSEKLPVKVQWERIEDFKKQLKQHGGNDSMCSQICQKVDDLIDG